MKTAMIDLYIKAQHGNNSIMCLNNIYTQNRFFFFFSMIIQIRATIYCFTVIEIYDINIILSVVQLIACNL